MDEFILKLVDWNEEYLDVREKVIDKAKYYIDNNDIEQAGYFLEISSLLGDLENKFLALMREARS